jgi:hypothetical protein
VRALILLWDFANRINPWVQTKRCSRCEENKPLTEYTRWSRSGDGYAPACKTCIHARNRAFYAANRERLLARAKARRASDPARQVADRQRVQRWNQDPANAERRRAYLRDYRVTHREADLARKRTAYRTDRVHHRQQQQANRRQNWLRERVWAANDYARRRGAPGVFAASDVERLHGAQAGRCAYCGVPLEAPYAIDHLVPLGRGGSNWPDNLALACHRCHTRKRRLTAEEFRVRLREAGELL